MLFERGMRVLRARCVRVLRNECAGRGAKLPSMANPESCTGVVNSAVSFGAIHPSRGFTTFKNVTSSSSESVQKRALQEEFEQSLAWFLESRDTVEPLAACLAKCREHAVTIELSKGIEEMVKLLSVEDGYRLQEHVENCLQHEHAWTVAGFKVGATSKAVQQRVGLDEPFFGALFEERVDVDDCIECVLREDTSEMWCSHGTVSKTALNIRGIEAEFVYQMKDTLKPREEPYTEEEVLAAVDSVFPCIEVCGSRFAIPLSGGLLIGDGAGNGLVMTGESMSVAPDHIHAIGADKLEVRTWVNGVVVARGSGKEVLGHPVHSLTWLVNRLSQEGLERQTKGTGLIRDWRHNGLQTGMLVCTGASNGLVPLEIGSQVIVEFNNWGALEMILTE